MHHRNIPYAENPVPLSIKLIKEQSAFVMQTTPFQFVVLYDSG